MNTPQTNIQNIPNVTIEDTRKDLDKNVLYNNYEIYDLTRLTDDSVNHTFNITNNVFQEYLHKMFVRVNLPDIYSSEERQFKWNKYLGYNIIKDVTLTITFDDNIKNKEKKLYLYTYGEWLYIWYELNLSEEDKLIHYELIGNTQDLYDPAFSSRGKGIYPVSHLNKQSYKWLITDDNTKKATTIQIENDVNYDKPPSINGKTLYIPLNFYFCNSLKDVLPLKYVKQTKIEIKLRNINDLYTVLLTPEDFEIKNQTTTINVSDTSFNSNVQLPSNIYFTNNILPVFSNTTHINTNESLENELSMFDCLINQYRIKPLLTGSTAINNFLLDTTSISIVNKKLKLNSINDFYIKLCDISIMYNKIISDDINLKKLNVSGILTSVNTEDFLKRNKEDEEIKKPSSYNANEIFLVIRHKKRHNQNDIFNFTNLDVNYFKPWERLLKNNTMSFNSNIEILSGSIWEHRKYSNSIKVGINEEGTVYFKKHILENGVFKYINILKYDGENSNETFEQIWNNEEGQKYKEGILSELKVSIDLIPLNSVILSKLSEREKIKYDIIKNKYDVVKKKEPYDFYNKVTTLSKYKSNIKGLYYFTNPTIQKIKALQLKNCKTHKINIHSSLNYERLIYYNELHTIDL